MWRDVARCGTMWHDVARCGAMWDSDEFLLGFCYDCSSETFFGNFTKISVE
jgi:predicted  nucleic acid-binding Zn-ribbon protein